MSDYEPRVGDRVSTTSGVVVDVTGDLARVYIDGHGVTVPTRSLTLLDRPAPSPQPEHPAVPLLRDILQRVIAASEDEAGFIDRYTIATGPIHRAAAYLPGNLMNRAVEPTGEWTPEEQAHIDALCDDWWSREPDWQSEGRWPPSAYQLADRAMRVMTARLAAPSPQPEPTGLVERVAEATCWEATGFPLGVLEGGPGIEGYRRLSRAAALAVADWLDEQGALSYSHAATAIRREVSP